MRNAFASEITSLAAKDARIVLLSGDIGNRLFNPFKEAFPNRFYNCGVAEANMTSMAAGMAMCGLKPVTYTIASFNTTRCLEQIRVDLCYHNLPVIVIGVGAGLAYANLGATHHTCEDIALLRSLPNMCVVCPGDTVEVKLALKAALHHAGPVYIRLGKKNEPVVHQHHPDFKIGKGIIVEEGRTVCLLSTGNMLPVAIEAGQLLRNRGITARVVSMHTVKPLDAELLQQTFSNFKLVVTVEEHSRIGGLGGSIAEWLNDQPLLRARLLRFGSEDSFLHASGNQENARRILGLTAQNICESVIHENRD